MNDAAGNDWRDALEGALGTGIDRLESLGGGDFARAFRASTGDGRVLFVKTHADPPPGFFTTEAAGLRWLREAEAAPVPAVLFASDAPPCLALEWIETGSGVGGGAGRGGEQGGERGTTRPGDDRVADGEAVFGRALAALHGAGAAVFGREDARTTGSLAVPNVPAPDWPTFYAERRLLPLARLAAERGALAARDVARLERLAARLDGIGAADEPPARLHGDLWAGNRLVDARGASWLIDPAAHGGHREFDLAMMRLFGGFDERCHAAYREVSPLADGWRERVPLHQLAPLVVHAIKFGGGYARGVAAALDACERL